MRAVVIKDKSGREQFWTKDRIKAEIEQSDAALIRAMFRIYEYQTLTEQATMGTHYRNGVGFNSADSLILTAYCQAYNKYGRLTEKQLAAARRLMPKYAGQIFNYLQESYPDCVQKITNKTNNQ